MCALTREYARVCARVRVCSAYVSDSVVVVEGLDMFVQKDKSTTLKHIISDLSVRARRNLIPQTPLWLNFRVLACSLSIVMYHRHTVGSINIARVE